MSTTGHIFIYHCLPELLLSSPVRLPAVHFPVPPEHHASVFVHQAPVCFFLGKPEGTLQGTTGKDGEGRGRAARFRAEGF